jgi:hypothetical protein
MSQAESGAPPADFVERLDRASGDGMSGSAKMRRLPSRSSGGDGPRPEHGGRWGRVRAGRAINVAIDSHQVSMIFQACRRRSGDSTALGSCRSDGRRIGTQLPAQEIDDWLTRARRGAPR